MTPVVLLSAAFLCTASTLVRPVCSLSLSSGGTEHIPPLPLRPNRERAGGTRELRGPAVMLNLRGGEELKSQSRKRGYADTGRGSSPKRSASPTKTHNNNHHKRPAIGSTIKRAAEAAKRLYEQGSDMVPILSDIYTYTYTRISRETHSYAYIQVPTLSDMKALPHKTYSSAKQKLLKLPVALRARKHALDAMPRHEFIQRVVAPILGVSAIIVAGCAAYVTGHGAVLLLLLQGWLARARSLCVEAWDLIGRSPSVVCVCLCVSVCVCVCVCVCEAERERERERERVVWRFFL
jgi:hypothetical protein